MNAFAAMVDAQFDDPNLSVDAGYRAGGTGEPVSVRVQWSAPEAVVGFGEASIDLDAMLLRVRLSEIADPQPGDTFEFEDDLVATSGMPKIAAVTGLSKIDARKLTRRLEVAPTE